MVIVHVKCSHSAPKNCAGAKRESLNVKNRFQMLLIACSGDNVTITSCTISFQMSVTTCHGLDNPFVSVTSVHFKSFVAKG